MPKCQPSVLGPDCCQACPPKEDLADTAGGGEAEFAGIREEFRSHALTKLVISNDPDSPDCAVLRVTR